MCVQDVGGDGGRAHRELCSLEKCEGKALKKCLQPQHPRGLLPTAVNLVPPCFETCHHCELQRD